MNLTVQYMYTLHTMLCVSKVLGKEFISYYLFVLPALIFRRDLLKIVRQRKKALQSKGNWESFGGKWLMMDLTIILKFPKTKGEVFQCLVCLTTKSKPKDI